jgi:hypothetical protein
MRLRQQEIKFDGRFFAAELKVVESDDVIGGEGSTDVDLEGRGSDSLVAVIEKVSQHVEQRRLVGDHLLELTLSDISFADVKII